MTKWEVAKEVTLFDTPENRRKVKYIEKMDVMMDDDRNEPPNGLEELKRLNNFLEFGKTYKFTISLEELP